MKSRLQRISIPLTVIALLALGIKGYLVGVTWPEAIAFPLILVIHYARVYLPRPSKELTTEQAQKLLQDIDALKSDMTKLKLRVGFSAEQRKK